MANQGPLWIEIKFQYIVLTKLNQLMELSLSSLFLGFEHIPKIHKSSLMPSLGLTLLL
jgi:hypothetical protein